MIGRYLLGESLLIYYETVLELVLSFDAKNGDSLRFAKVGDSGFNACFSFASELPDPILFQILYRWENSNLKDNRLVSSFTRESLSVEGANSRAKSFDLFSELPARTEPSLGYRIKEAIVDISKREKSTLVQGYADEEVSLLKSRLQAALDSRKK